MDPFRICPRCEQSVRIIYDDTTSKRRLVFEEHKMKDHFTRCDGSKELVAGVSVEIEKPPTEPLNSVPASNKMTCPECRQSVRVKKNLRGTMIFSEHFGDKGRQCSKSFKPAQ